MDTRAASTWRKGAAGLALVSTLVAASFAAHAAPPTTAPQSASSKPFPVPTACFQRSAARYGVDANLLIGVARAESGMNPNAINMAAFKRTGTYAIGLMQIQSSWLPKLARYGIGEHDLHDACTSIDVGAWILADALTRHGNRWAAVGAYDAACTTLKGDACTARRASYAWSVYRRMPNVQAAQHAAPMRVAPKATVAEFQMVSIGATGR